MSENKEENTSLVNYVGVDNTPFEVAELEKKDSKEKEYFIMFGKYRLTEDLGSVEKAKDEAVKVDWLKIMGVCHAIAESIVESKLKTK